MSNTKTILYGAFHEPSSTRIGPCLTTFAKLIIAATRLIMYRLVRHNAL